MAVAPAAWAPFDGKTPPWLAPALRRFAGCLPRAVAAARVVADGRAV